MPVPPTLVDYKQNALMESSLPVYIIAERRKVTYNMRRIIKGGNEEKKKDEIVE